MVISLTRTVGNHLGLAPTPRWKRMVLMSLITALLVPLMKLLIDSSVNTFSIDLMDIFYGSIVVWLIYVATNISLLTSFFKKYFSWNNGRLVVMFGFNVLVLLLFFIQAVSFEKGYFGLYLVIFFWITSGILQSMLIHTLAILSQEISEYLKISKIYAILRLSSYFVLIIYLQIFVINYFDLLTLYSILIPLMFLPYFLLNLTPYYYKDVAVEKTVNIIRFIHHNQPVKKQLILAYFNDDDWFNKQIDILVQINLLKVIKKRYFVS